MTRAKVAAVAEMVKVDAGEEQLMPTLKCLSKVLSEVLIHQIHVPLVLGVTA